MHRSFKTFRLPVFLVVAAISLGSGLLHAQQVPASVKLVVGYAAGGPVDQAARQIAPALGRELGATVVVENRPGANATTAGDGVAKGPADGSCCGSQPVPR